MAPTAEVAKPRKPVQIFSERFREEELRKRELAGEEKISMAELNKLMGIKWKEMPDEQKSVFKKQSEKEKRDFAAANQDEDGSDEEEEEKPRRKVKKVKDPNAPKRSMSSFFHFSQEHRATIKAQNPEFGIQDVARELGRIWKTMDEASKDKYVKLAQVDKGRYEIAIREYKEQNPNAA